SPFVRALDFFLRSTLDAEKIFLRLRNGRLGWFGRSCGRWGSDRLGSLRARAGRNASAGGRWSRHHACGTRRTRGRGAARFLGSRWPASWRWCYLVPYRARRHILDLRRAHDLRRHRFALGNDVGGRLALGSAMTGGGSVGVSIRRATGGAPTSGRSPSPCVRRRSIWAISSEEARQPSVIVSISAPITPT